MIAAVLLALATFLGAAEAMLFLTGSPYLLMSIALGLAVGAIAWLVIWKANPALLGRRIFLTTAAVFIAALVGPGFLMFFDPSIGLFAAITGPKLVNALVALCALGLMAMVILHHPKSRDHH